MLIESGAAAMTANQADRGDMRQLDHVEPTGSDVLADAPDGGFRVEGVRVDDRVTLVLHGDVNGTSVPHLEAVLDGLQRLQPLRLVVDLSDVERVSLEALRMMDRCGSEVGALVLRSPGPSIRSDLGLLGRSELIEGDLLDPLPV